MRRYEVTPDTVLERIETFYEPTTHHFLTVNGIDLGEGRVEMQWIFCEYGRIDAYHMFVLTMDYETPLPSLITVIPSAYLSEMEMVDLFGITIGEQPSGLYLDPDSLRTPLRKTP